MNSAEAEQMRQAQRAWEAQPIAVRTRVLKRLRLLMASRTRELAESVPTHLPGSLHRTVADTMVAEVLPLISACEFLETDSAWILRTRTLSKRGRPKWLPGVEGWVERAPWGRVLVIAASNYPLLLAGVQTLQALIAGNAVLWKPAPGTESAALTLLALLLEAGLPKNLLHILDTNVETVDLAIRSGVDFIALTSSANTGSSVAHKLADTLTPAVMELSGCDALFLLKGADLDHAIDALCFGLRFNGSFTCMAPRRIFLVGLSNADASRFEQQLADRLAKISPAPLSERTRTELAKLIRDARLQGANIVLDGLNGGHHAEATPTLISSAKPTILAMQTDIFAPVACLIRVATPDEALAADAACPYGLTASIFGPENPARDLARRLSVGNITINSLIAPTADPRVPFGGRGRSGYGVTRGEEGLMAMTTPRTVQVQHGRPRRAYEITGQQHIELFAGLAQWMHGSLTQRFAGLGQMISAARHLRGNNKEHQA